MITKFHHSKDILKEDTLTVNQTNISFDDLYSSLWVKMLNRVCRKYTIDNDKAQDYCQNGFIKVYNNIHKYVGKGSLEGWVSRVISNSILDELRGGRVEITDGGLEGFDLTSIKMVENIYEEPEYSMSETLRLVQYLPSSQKKSIKMYYLDGLQHKEISKILGISVGTSKSNLSKAKKALKRYLVDGVPQNSLKKKYK